MTVTGAFENIVLCNGALIHEAFVLTTADCMQNHMRSGNMRYIYFVRMFKTNSFRDL